MLRPLAEMMPAVTVPPSANGLPTAMTQSPTRDLSLSPNFTAVRGLAGLTRNTARSTLASLPMISARSLVPSVKMTSTSLAPSMTWLLVTTMPEGSITKPEPSELERCGWPSPFCWRRRFRYSSNMSSSGEPGGSFGMSTAFSSTTWVAEILTTAGVTVWARSAKESGAGAARTGAGGSTASAPAKASPASRRRAETVLVLAFMSAPPCYPCG